MKLLVCDIEGTIFKPHMIKSAQHASYIWTAIAEALGRDAEKEEIATQRKWRAGCYGPTDTGTAYIQWVNDSIGIHARYGLRQSQFEELIRQAPYYEGVLEFFRQLDRSQYIPVFVSGGIQNLNHRACRDLQVSYGDSYASCEYFFDEKGELDTDLTFSNTCDFFGKQELIRIALRRHGLGSRDWVFIGDGINDVSVAKAAPLSIGIAPVEQLREAADYSFRNFEELMQCRELMEKTGLLGTGEPAAQEENTGSLEERMARKVCRQVGNLGLDRYEKRAYHRYQRAFGKQETVGSKNRFFGIQELLQAGETTLELWKEAPQMPSAVLQPFCSAAEIMVNVTLVLSGKEQILHDILEGGYSLQREINSIGNPGLKQVLTAYRINRNAIAHTYQPIGADAARALARRTYENIQRMELLLEPPEPWQK